MTLLRIEGLRVHFESRTVAVPAVDDLSLHVDPGEVVGLVGESGCGKTVTALSVMGLVPAPPGRIADGSSIRFRDHELVGMPERDLRRLRGHEMAMIFQEPMSSLNPVLTTGTQIGEALRLHRRMDRRAARREALGLLREVGIPDPERRLDEYPHQLSGGMRQRVMIAMALSCRPSLLIADEPTTALDVTIQAQILELLRELRRARGMAVLLITHDLGVVAELCDRVVVMYAGQVVETGPASTLFDRPRHPYTAGLLASLPGTEPGRRRLRPIEGSVPDPDRPLRGCRFRDRCPDAWERCGSAPPPLFSAAGGIASRCWKEDPGSRNDLAHGEKS